jgi:signal transduction histidine kinase/BarA-like signal transduction histidine kinase
MFYSFRDIPEEDFRTAGRFCARNARLGVQTHPVGTLAIVIAAHLGQAPAGITLVAFAGSLIVAIWRWFAARSIVRAPVFSKRLWIYRVAVPALIANLIWALMASATFWIDGLGSTSTLIMLGSVAISFGCISSFAPMRILSLPLLVIHLGLPLIAVILNDSPERLILAVLLIAFLLYILRIANAAHHDYWSALQIRNGLTESRLQAEQASHAKDQFLANISHEIRTPLNGITAPVELLQQSALSTDQRYYLDLISSSSQTLMQLIDDLLDFSKMEAGKLRLQPRPFAPLQLLRDITERHRLTAEHKQLQLQFTATGLEQCSLLGDPLRIGQIIDNLLSNAVKFTAVGRIDVLAQVYVKGDVAQLVIDIVDTGDGISHDLQPDIFKPFVQAELAPSRRYTGTGLGLSICKRLTEQMHGNLSFSSNAGQGTHFTLQLLLPLSERTTARETDSTLRSFSGLRVLVAEDNLVNQQVIQRQLALLQIVPDIVGDGLEALAATERNHYDLIILDCQMPELDGYQCATRLRAAAATADTPIIALTAHAMSNDMQRALDAGMSDYLSKPVAMATLSNTIARWVYGAA